MCVTEMNEREEIDRLVRASRRIRSVPSWRQPKLIFESGSPGRSAIEWAEEGGKVEVSIPSHLLRRDIAGFPELGELEVLRHFTRLSQRNFSIESQFYPLGSCTMKYNPKINEVGGASARLRADPSHGVARAFAGRVGAALRAGEDVGRR